VLFFLRTALAYCLPVLPTGLARWFQIVHGDVKPFATPQAQMVIKGIFTLAGVIDVSVFWITRKKSGAFLFLRQNVYAGQGVIYISNSNTDENIKLELAAEPHRDLNKTQNPAITPLSRIQTVIRKVKCFVRRYRECLFLWRSLQSPSLISLSVPPYLWALANGGHAAWILYCQEISALNYRSLLNGC
jgi:hypothetical protein